MGDEQAASTDASWTSMRSRIGGLVVAILVVLGIIASVPMLPLLIVAWVGIAIRSPGAGYGMARGTANALGSTAPGELYGFSGRFLFPMVAAGWVLIALLAGGVIGAEVPFLGWIVGLSLFIVPTLVIYRSMHPEIASVPFVEWIGSRRPGPVAAPLATWIACAWLVWSITTWTTFVGSRWTTICTFVFALSVLVLPVLFLLITPRGGQSLYRFIGVAFAVGLVSLGAYLADLTPAPKWP